MQELAGLIVNHPNGKTFIIELLNSVAPTFFYETLSVLSPQNGWKTPDGVKEDVKKILNTFLNTHNGVKASLKDSVDDETARSALIYLLNTFHTRIQKHFPAASIATWVTLERKEEDFKQFRNDLEEKDPSIKINEALLAYWVYSG